MAKPATTARLAASARGFTQVIKRGDNHIVTRDPTTGKCAYDGQVGGGWHYNGDQETDTAWTAGVAPWDFQMTKALYNAYAVSQFNAAQIIKWVDPATGQNVTFQPAALQWTNSLNQIQQISMPQAVAAQASDDILYWPAAYGTGRNFRYQASPLRLNKQLIIDSPSALPSTSYDTLELNFVISVSGGVNIMVDGAAWDKKTTRDTANSIAFQLPGGAVLWSFAIPRAWDSAGNETTGSMRLKKQGNSLYVSVRFAKSWIDSIYQNNYPIIFDPTVDYQVGAGANDGFCTDDPVGFNNANTVIAFGRLEAGSAGHYTTFMRWPTVTIPAGATITASYISTYYYGKTNTPPACTLGFEDAANPAAISSASDGASRTITANTISFTGPSSGTWSNSNSINAIIQELIDANSYAGGAAMQCIVKNYDTLEAHGDRSMVYSYEGGASKAAKLHIEYIEAVSGNPFYAYAQQ